MPHASPGAACWVLSSCNHHRNAEGCAPKRAKKTKCSSVAGGNQVLHKGGKPVLCMDCNEPQPSLEFITLVLPYPENDGVPMGSSK